MALTHHQRRVAFHILDVGRQMGASYRDQVAAIATALGEANLGNPWGGEGSSVGWRQEISSYGSAAKRHNVRRVARDFYGEIRNKPGSAAAAAFAVQRPAQRGDYYARYVGQARQIVKELGKGGKGFKDSGGGGGRLPGTLTGHLRTIPGVDRSAERQQLRLSYLGKSKMPSQASLLNLASQLRNVQDTPSSQVYDIKRVPGRRVGGGGGGGGRYVHPFPGASVGRVDQGQDFTGNGRILAIGRAKVLASTSHASGWPEGGWVSYRLLDGPHKGKVVYVAEGIHPHVRPGQIVRAGQQVASFHGSSIETGWGTNTAFRTLAAARGHVAAGSHHSPEGEHFRRFLSRLQHHRGRR